MWVASVSRSARTLGSGRVRPLFPSACCARPVAGSSVDRTKRTMEENRDGAIRAGPVADTFRRSTWVGSDIDRSRTRPHSIPNGLQVLSVAGPSAPGPEAVPLTTMARLAGPMQNWDVAPLSPGLAMERRAVRGSTKEPAGPAARACADLVLNLTQRCPLRCAHCCYRAGGRATGSMSGDLMRRAIRSAAGAGTVRTVHFTGGDPFVLPDLMRSGTALAAELGLRVAAVTSGWFATTPRRAHDVLRPLADAGLSELCVSYDDMHAVFVGSACVQNAMEAAHALGVRGLVSVVVAPDSLVDGSSVRRLLSGLIAEGNVKVYEVALNTTGRASDDTDMDARAARAAADLVYRGPCRGVLRTVQVLHDGRILPCCGTLPPAADMVIGSIDSDDDGLATALRRAASDPLWAWIAEVGPVEMLRTATAAGADPLAPEDFDGVCTACDRLFNEPALLEAVRAAYPGFPGTPDGDAANTAATPWGFSERTRDRK